MGDVNVMVRPAGGEGQGIAGAGPYEFLLEHDGLWRTTPLIWPPPVADWTTLEAFQQEVHADLNGVMTTIQNNPAAKVMSKVQTLGMRLWKVLMPREIQETLAKAQAAASGEPPVLRIHSTISWIPWEIMYDGKGFLGIRFQVARLPIVYQGPEIADGQVRTVERIYSLLGENVLDGAQLDAWKNTFAPLAAASPRAQVVTFPSAPGWDNYPLVETLLTEISQPDIVHITCHGPDAKQQGRTFWTLNEGPPEESRIDIPLVEGLGPILGETRPLVFGNACASVGANPDVLSVSGFGAAFFNQGVLAFIGTFAPVSKQMAVEFAREFYARLLGGSGMSVGRALCETKRFFHKPGQNDPSYLFYCLHGPPETHFALAGDA